MKRDLHGFFEPKIIAVVGASNSEEKVGGILMKKLSKFGGEIIPINPNHKTILGRISYPSISDFSKEIDLVLIATPAKTISKILEDCGKKKIKNVVIISSGFSEIGNKKQEEELVKIAGKYKINLLGPNCFGVANPWLNLDTTFAMASAKKGDVAFISQSGALWSYICDFDFGFSGFVSLGNMSDLSFEDFIEYFEKDKKTKKIVLYIEKLKNGKKFIDVCQKSKKEIVVIKVGKSDEGSKAALSHTGSLATDFKIYDGAFRQAEVKVKNSLYQAMNPEKQNERFISSLNSKNNVLIITNAGGAGALISDLCVESGFKLSKIPENISKTNPIDILGTASSENYRNFLEKVREKNFYDLVIVVLTPQSMSKPEKVAEEVVKFSKTKKVIACFLGDKSVKKAVDILRKNKIPVFTRCC